MSFNIIDKNPRKPRKEGPKAQKKYVEELQAEWIDGHMLNQPFVDPNAREAEVPPDVRERYARLEEQTVDQVKANLKAAEDAILRESRTVTVAKLARAEMDVYGYVRENLWHEIVGLRLERAAREAGCVPPPEWCDLGS